MRKKNIPEVSVLQCRMLSELILHGPKTCTQLAELCDMNRSVLYVLMRRLAAHGLARRRRVHVPKRIGMQVLYSITAKGRKAREQLAHRMGLALPEKK